MANILYLISAICFIMALRGLSSAQSSKSGNMYGIVGMGGAFLAAILTAKFSWYPLVAIIIGGCVGILVAKKVSMTQLPEMVAGFHSLVGLSAVMIDCAAYFSPDSFHIVAMNGQIFTSSLIEIGLGLVIGAVTFTGSIVAFLKLKGSIKECFISIVTNKLIALAIFVSFVMFVLTSNGVYLCSLIVLSLILGITLIVPIGGADMPVVVSMLNSYSGWAASGIGFTLHNDLLIITGALVGSSGAILSYIMCKGMNRSLKEVMFSSGIRAIKGAFEERHNRPYTRGMPEDAAFLLKNANSVIIVPGYGMATSQAQHALKEMGDMLKKRGISVKYAIHPVAGRMPGHMNVLLAEANVPYDDVFELDEINSSFAACDVAYVVGANDVTNPAAKSDPDSSIYGMPVLDVEKAKTVLFLKRSMGAGYAGIDNDLFYAQNTMMLLGDAKKTTENIIKSL
ncbi:MAG: NAD(P)(+) transhydrogenase (Re/Si-specific) subunit beta [Alphaproteobacteria bacterium]|nr:NAD(P)(+) transhydrogenase (Re/Si-specific) subunit beta [Alphaproteobacteria bacterium]